MAQRSVEQNPEGTAEHGRPLVHIPAGYGRAVRVLTDVVVFKLVEADTDGAFFLAEVTLPPGGGGPPMLTAHPSQEIWYILEGEFEFEGLDGESPLVFRAGPGSLVHAPGGAAHRLRNVGATPGRFLSLHVPAGIERFFAALGQPADTSTTPATPPDRERMLALARAHGLEFIAAPGGQPAAR